MSIFRHIWFVWQHAERSTVNSNQESDQKSVSKITEEKTLNDYPDKFNFADASFEHISLGPGIQAIDATLSKDEEGYSGFISNQHGESGQSRARDNSNSASVSHKNVSTFEAAAAEAELDMLLNSLSETKLLEMSGLNAEKPSSNFHREDSSPLPQLARKGVDSSKSAAVNSSLDGLLDDLLQETSSMVNQGVNPSVSAAVSSTIDDLLDDLLQETSPMVNQNGLSEHDEDVKAARDNNMQSSSSSQSVLKSKVLNDFDSWLDTI